LPRATREWHLAATDDDAVRTLSQAAGISNVVSQLLLVRGVGDARTARAFLDSPMSNLHAPQKLPNLDRAVELIRHAVATNARICIYGDYDVDGTTGTAILLGLLHKLNARATFYVPHRLEEGYGLNAQALRQLAADGVQLLITVDCGIASVSEADLAGELGVTLVVTDHHEMKAELPKAAAVVHPRLPGSEYPFGGLCGAGVAFKLAWGLAQKVSGSERVTPELREFLMDAMGLSALGLIADVVPLRDENRVFVKHGLKRLVADPPVGLQALLAVSGLAEGKPLRAEDIGYRIAPRINAAGRLGCARLVVELLTTKSPAKAKEIAEFLEGQNKERQAIERKIVKDAREMVEAHGFHEQSGIVLAHPDWHPGVVGIVAGRIAEYYARPTLVVAVKEGDVSTGSARSVPGFAVNEALQGCDAVLEGHGGHAAAAGFRVRNDRIDELREAFCSFISSHQPGGPAAPQLHLDAELPLASLTFGLLQELDKLEPYGSENPRPKFLATGLTVEQPKTMGQGERHLAFRVKQGNTTLRAVAFGMAENLEDLLSQGGQCCLAFTPKLNEWNGARRVELEVHDYQPGPTARLA
jgi:single-stranded-DNA-specific exonuclease